MAECWKGSSRGCRCYLGAAGSIVHGPACEWTGGLARVWRFKKGETDGSAG